jgi:cation-transporting ATPase F
MGEFAGLLLWVILGLAALTFAIGVLRGESWVDMLIAAVALAVGAIPEGLPAAMSITLAIGVGRMAKRRAIIRHLPAVEALGSTTVICSDKTGTLTENAMTVTELWTGGEAFIVDGQGYRPEGRVQHGETAVAPAPTSGIALHQTLLAGVLCNDAALYHEHGQWQITGDPTEAALLVVARKEGLDETTLRSVFPRRDELPFDSARQTMATLHEVEGRPVAYVKGAIEKLLPACRAMLAADGSETALEPAALEAGRRPDGGARPARAGAGAPPSGRRRGHRRGGDRPRPGVPRPRRHDRSAARARPSARCAPAMRPASW